MIRPFILSLQTASVAGSAQGFKSSDQIPALVRIDTVFIDSTAADGDVYAMVGASPHAVTSLALAQGGLPFIDRASDCDTTVSRNVVPLASGAMPIVGIGFILAAPLTRLFLGVINEGSTSVKVTALFQGVYLATLDDFDSDYLSPLGGIDGAQQLPKIGQAGGTAPGQFAAAGGTQATQVTTGPANALGWAAAIEAAAKGTPEDAQRVLRLLQRAMQTGGAIQQRTAPTPP